MVDSVTQLAQQTQAANRDAELALIDAANSILQRNVGANELTPDLIATRVVRRADGTLVITTASGKERTINQDDADLFNKNNNENLALREQNRNELEAFKRWAAENTSYTAEYLDNIQSSNDLVRDPRYKDFGNYVNDVTSQTGQAPYQTPYARLKAAEQLASTSLRSPFVSPGGEFQFATLDNILPPGGAQLAGSETAALKRALTNQNKQQVINYQQGTVGEAAINQARAINAQVQSRFTRFEVESNNTTSSYYSPSLTGEDGRGLISKDIDNQASSPAVDSKFKDNSRPNPLDQYTSYTYSLSLHVLTKDEYNGMVQSNGKVARFTNTLIAGAGRAMSSGDTGLKRAKGWEDNFYFDNLKFTSIIGLNGESRGTNVTEISFTIFEPNGLSLMDRLMTITKELSNELYFASCYVIQIDFFDSEKGLLQNLRKYIPIRFTDMKVKVTAKGSEYSCSAIPFGHHALLQSYAGTPANFEVTAGTLQEFFKSDENDSAQVAGKALREKRQQETSIGATATNFLTATSGTRIKSDLDTGEAGDKTYSIKSYTSAFNGWFKTLQELGLSKLAKPPTIAVVFDQEITKDNGGQIYRPRDQSATPGSSTMVNPDNPRTNGDDVPAQKDRDVFSFAAGTLVTEVINTAMMHSEYIRRQIKIQKDKQSATEQDGFLKWWKIIPKVELQEFDKENNTWSFATTYYVIPYNTINTTHPDIPKAKPYKANCVKQYQYLYTGQNTSVLDFQCEFDFLYFTRVMALRNKDVDNTYDNPEIFQQGFGTTTPSASKNSGINASVTKFTVDEPVGRAGRGLNDDVGVVIANISENLYSKAGGEMLAVTLKILGDPELIKQDDIYTGIVQKVEEKQNPEAPRSVSAGGPFPSAVAFVGAGGAAVTETSGGPQTQDLSDNNNSLIMDTGDVLAWVALIVPVDIDDRTGGMRKGAKGDVSGFTGVYKIMIVDNEFRNGTFTQSLELIRYQNQPQDYNNEIKKTDERAEAVLDENSQRQDDIKLTDSSGFDESAFVNLALLDPGADSENPGVVVSPVYNNRDDVKGQPITTPAGEQQDSNDIQTLLNNRYAKINTDQLPEEEFTNVG